MKADFRKLTALIVIVSMASSSMACMAMKPIAVDEPGEITTYIKAGDTLQYRTRSGEVETLRVTAVNGEMLQGVSDGQQRTIVIADMESIGKEGSGILRTPGLSLGFPLFLLLLPASSYSGGGIGPGMPGR